MRGMNLGLACLIAAMSVAGCLARPGSQPATAVPTFQAATATIEVQDTATLAGSTLTPTPSPTATHTLTPFPPTVTPTDTPDLSRTATIQAVVASYPAKTRASYPSPDQKWQADVVVYNECTPTIADTNSYEVLKLIDLSMGSEKVIVDELLNCGGIGAGGLGGLFWSSNSRYFYSTTAAFGVPDGCCCLPWLREILRLDVTTLETVGRTGLVSPDYKFIASWGANDITLSEVDSDQEILLAAVETASTIVTLSWAPDGQAFVYLQDELDPSNPCLYSPNNGRSAVVRVDLPGYHQQVVLTADAPGYTGLTWDAPNRIRLSDLQGNQWRYNFVTQELTQE